LAGRGQTNCSADDTAGACNPRRHKRSGSSFRRWDQIVKVLRTNAFRECGQFLMEEFRHEDFQITVGKITENFLVFVDQLGSGEVNA
jgi:hypothetical protein